MQKNKSMFPTLTVGIIAGTAIGLVASGMTSHSSRRKIKRQAEQAVHTMSGFAKDLGDMIKK